MLYIIFLGLYFPNYNLIMEETTLVEKIEETVVTIPEIVDEKSKNVDPYAYLDKDFTSEKFKIEIKNMPKFYGISVSIADLTEHI